MARKHSLRGRLLIFPQFQLKLLGANLAVIAAISAIIARLMALRFSGLSMVTSTMCGAGCSMRMGMKSDS
jgi:predicted molibdopterin-dependent oxidoreductase YjgC